MAEFVPVPIGRLLRRANREYSRQGAVFGLPEQKFYRPPALRDADTAPGPSTLDLSVRVSGQRAGNPMGLAAGPHTQLAQNIALGWLAGARVFELKTVQVNDRITVPRPCIDAATIGYNTEWSQELRLDESLREYVKASMLIEALEAMGILGRGIGLEGRESPGGPPPRATPVDGGVVFDASVGYDLEGIRSPAMASWLESIRSAGAIVDDLRREIAAAFPGLRDFPFKTRIAAGVTVSTFHHTPPGEIERIGEFLIGDLGFHTMIKVSPPMLVRDIEIACRNLLLQHLDAGEDSVGTRVEIDHIGATLLGMQVTLKVRVAEVNGRAVVFEIDGHDPVEPIVRGKHARFVVDVAKTGQRLAAKAAKARGG